MVFTEAAISVARIEMGDGGDSRRTCYNLVRTEDDADMVLVEGQS